MFDWGTTEDLSQKAQDKLARTVLSRFRDATVWQSTERVGDSSLRQVLADCHAQYHGLLSPHDREMAEALGVDARVNLTAMKAGVVTSFLAETIISSDALPWVISPTPIPDLSERNRQEALEMVKAELFTSGFQGDLLALVREVKDKVRTKEKERADTAARAMEKKMQDQCAEGGWRQAMNAFLGEFAYQPFAVLQGPAPVRRATLEWRGNKLAAKESLFYDFKAISVFDFWYTPDSPDTQRGAGVFIRQRWTRQQVIEASRMKSYFASSLHALLEESLADGYKYRWLSANPDQPDTTFNSWVNRTGTIDVLIHYGYFSGRELDDYGIKGLDKLEMYNATVTVIAGKTVQVFVAPNPSVALRPIFTASFYQTKDRIPGAGLAQRLRDVERCFQASLRYMMRNAANAAEPIVEADYARLAVHMTDQDLTNLTPGGLYLVDNDGMSGSQAPAIRPFNIPSILGEYQRLMDYFMELAHYVTNIPAALHGTAEGSGANRTFRGAAMLQGNAIKAIQSAVGNIDQGVFFPCGELLFNYNNLYEKDEDIKGDCRVLAQGVSGLLAREMDRNNAMELLQLVGSAGAQLGDKAPQLFAWALNKLLNTMGVPEELLASPSGPPAQAAPGGVPDPAAPGVPNGNPEPQQPQPPMEGAI